MKIDITKKITYLQALLLPFSITPLLTFFYLTNAFIKIGLISFSVIATANFIDSSLLAIQNPSQANWNSALMWLCIILFIRLYFYIEEPIWRLLDKKKQEKEWRLIDYPAIKLRACINLHHIENSETNDLISRMCRPSGALCSIQKHLIDFIIFIGGILSYAIILLINAPLTGCFILITSLPMIFIARKSALAQYKIKQDTTEMERRVTKLRDFLQARDCVSERQLFTYFDFINDKFKETFFKSRKTVLQAEVNWGIKKGLAGVILTLLCALAIFALLPSVSTGALAIGMYISLVQSIFKGAQDIAYNLSPFLETFYTDFKFLKEYELYTKLERTPDSLSSLSCDAYPFKELVFDHVSFTYPGTDYPVLRDVSFKIMSGKRYSLVGLNGSGKSTIIKLILKFYDNYTGNIYLNGKQLNDWPLSDIKRMMSAVFQDFYHYDISLADNVSIGSGLMASSAEIIEAINATGLSNVVEQFPEGINTNIGKIYENGVDLSGGQWQKIAIARMMVSNSTFRIFDEPTASLDPISERNLYDYFNNLSKNVTTITISHRLASCIHSDQILFLENGIIQEQGTHDELIALGGKYKEMFESQRAWYI